MACKSSPLLSTRAVYLITFALSAPVHTLYDLEPRSVPFFLSLEQSIEILTSPSSSGAGSGIHKPLPPPPQELGDIGEEFQSHMDQEFIDKLDTVRHIALAEFSSEPKRFFRRWTIRHVIETGTGCLTPCASCVVVSG